MKIKPIIVLAIAAYGVLVGVKLVPIWSDDKAVVAGVDEVMRFAGTNQLRSIPEVQGAILDKVKDSLPADFKIESIMVEDERTDWRVHFGWKREIPLIFWTYRKEHSVDKRGSKS